MNVPHDEHCWVLDFGLASYRNSHTADDSAPAEVDRATSGQLGTPAYMAPEAFDRHADERTDVWGLGAILYCC